MNNIQIDNLIFELVSFFKENNSKCAAIDINGQTKLSEDLELDSLDLVELVMKLEETYCIKISDDQLGSLKTIEDVAKLIQELKSN